MKPLFARLFGCLLVGMAGLAAAQNTNEPQNMGPRSDWEAEQARRNFKESEVRLPPYPKDTGLIEFTVSVLESFRFFIDPASLTVSDDRVVRYTLIARSPSGVNNISYEGMRCDPATYKIYARGDNGKWTPQDTDWRPIEAKTIQRWHNELQWQYFCPMGRGTILSAQEGLDALRRGKLPDLMTRPGY